MNMKRNPSMTVVAAFMSSSHHRGAAAMASNSEKNSSQPNIDSIGDAGSVASGTAALGNLTAAHPGAADGTPPDEGRTGTVAEPTPINALALILQKFDGGRVPASFAPSGEIGMHVAEGTGWFYREYDATGYLRLRTGVDDRRTLERDLGADDDGSGGDGGGYLRVEYGVEQSEAWGGFVEVGRIAPARASTSGDDRLSFSTPPYDCRDATHVRLGYRVAMPQTLVGRAHLRLVLLDSSDCIDSQGGNETAGASAAAECAALPGQNLEIWVSFHYILDDNNGGWKELSTPWTSFERPGWSGQVGNDVLDPGAIRGWRIEISIDSQGELRSLSEGVIDFDALSCVASPDDDGAIIDSPFLYEGNFTDAISHGVWSARHHRSASSGGLSSAHLLPGAATLVINYTIEQSEERGGFVDYSHISPGFYDLSAAEAVALDYEVMLPVSVPGRAHLRLILLDGSDCTDNNGQCDAYPGQALENYYSFHYVLDNKGARDRIQVPLVGNADPDSPFYRTNWTGVAGNNRLDKNFIRGFRLEINIDSAGEVGSVVSGTVAFGNITAVLPDDSTSPSDNSENDGEAVNAEDQVLIPEASFVIERDLYFDISSPTYYQKIEFVASRCGELCENDSRCLFAHDNGRDCYLFSGLDSSSVKLANTEFLRTTTASGWMDDRTKRGDFCSVCSCEEAQALIDCSGLNLTIAPKLFDRHWSPLSIDLRDNPSLLVLGQGTFESISSTLQSIYLPRETVFISPRAFRGLSDLATVQFEDEVQDISLDQSTGINFIHNNMDLFGDVCCSVVDGSGGLSFCELDVFVPGIDCIYEPYIQYYSDSETNLLQEIRPSSSFMSEAAESPEMCAEYCAIVDKCRYFSYNALWKQSEHRCYLLESKGTMRERICCAPDDYADEDGTIPGWTSGWTPRTRYEEGSRVIFSEHDLEASEENGFEVFYDVALGSDPLRGAVWVEPKLHRTDGFEVSIFPQRLVLYDANTTMTVNVFLPNVDVGVKTTLIINHVITSCDAAFASAKSVDQANTEDVYIKIVPPPQNMQRNIIIVLGSIFGATILTLAAYRSYKRYKAWQAITRAHEQQMESMLNEATSALRELDYPLHLVRGDEFVKEGQLVRHEIMRNTHRLTVLDSLSDVDAFIEAGNEVVFFSHQWTAFDAPDPNKRQYAAMVNAIKALAARNEWDPSLICVYVWVDFSCIPQSNASVQSLAIRSLAVYASSATHFVIVAPTTPHTGLDNMCNLDTYQRRMWCRAEQVCHSMRNGTENMFLAVSDHEEDQVCSVKSDFFRESLHVFDGELTCCRLEHKEMDRCDRQSLVVPILGLYGELFRAANEGITGADRSMVEAFLQEIDEHQDEVFPRTFKRVMWEESKRVVEEVLLFGDLIDRMRSRIKKGTRVSILRNRDSKTSMFTGSEGPHRTFVRHGAHGAVKHGLSSKTKHESNSRMEAELAVPLDPNVVRPIDTVKEGEAASTGNRSIVTEE